MLASEPFYVALKLLLEGNKVFVVLCWKSIYNTINEEKLNLGRKRCLSVIAVACAVAM